MDVNKIYQDTLATLHGLNGQQAQAQNELKDVVSNGTNLADQIGTAIQARNNNLGGVINPASQATAEALTVRNSLLADAAPNYMNPFNALKEVAIKQQPYLAAADSLGRVRDLVAGDIGRQTQVGVGALDDKIKGLELLLNYINQGRANALQEGNLGLSVAGQLFSQGMASRAAGGGGGGGALPLSTASGAANTTLSDIQKFKQGVFNPTPTAPTTPVQPIGVLAPKNQTPTSVGPQVIREGSNVFTNLVDFLHNN